MSRYSTLSERTYRRQFSELYGFMRFNRALITEAIAAEHFQVGIIDASFVPKSGRATYGLDRFYNGKASRSERGLEISMIAVVDVEQMMGYTLCVQQTPAAEVISETDADAAKKTRVDHYLAHLQATRTAFAANLRYLVGMASTAS